MRTLFCLYLSIFAAFSASAQQTTIVNNLQIGYQEFPTVITGHAADSQGNQYYSGYFRGLMRIGKTISTNGAGLEDVFWVKTDKNGEVVRILSYGTHNSERAYTNAMAMGESNLLFGINTQEPLQLGNKTLTPYQYGPNAFASGLVGTDTAGVVQWVRRTNLQNFRILYNHHTYHILATIPLNFPAIRFEDSTVLDSLGKPGLVHLMLDTSGNFLGAKSIATRGAGQAITLMNAASFSDDALFFQLLINGDSSIRIHQTPVQIPGDRWNYQVLVKVDTSYQHFRYKVLNPDRHNTSGLINVMSPSTVAGDSVYVAFCSESSSSIPVPYVLDGVVSLSKHNYLYVFDSTLSLKRHLLLGNSVLGEYPTNIYKRRIYLRHMLVQNGRLFLNGVYTGINESPLHAIPVSNTTATVLPGVSTTIDLNGPSKSFMASLGLDGASGMLNWYGNHSAYENIELTPASLHPAGPQRIAFHQMADNVWNPWLMNENLQVVTGSMRRNADLPDSPQMIRFFSDGSRLVLGYARGNTAFDMQAATISNGGRRDIFLLRLRPNNEVVWFKRLHSTLFRSEARQLEIRNGKAYFLVNFLGTQNDSNYIKVENAVYPVRVNASLLASIDTAGTITVLNLQNPLLSKVYLMSMGFFSNGDLVVGTDVNPVPYLSFPQTFSPHLFRLNPSTGTVLEGRKLMSAGSYSISTIQVDKNDQIYINGSSYHPYYGNLSLHNGTTMISDLSITANSQLQGTLLKLSWNRLMWQKRFSGNMLMDQSSNLALVNDKPVVGIQSGISTQPLQLEGQIVHNGVNTLTFSVLKLDTDGTLLTKKILPNTIGRTIRSANGQLYVSGNIHATVQIDTIQVGYGGGGADALGLVLDSNLVAKKSFRITSPYSESMNDMDVYQDTLTALAYTAQGVPILVTNRNLVATSDYQEDAFLGTITNRTTIVTGINDPLPAFNHIAVSPNPVINKQLQLAVQVTEPLRSVCTVYGSNGQSFASEIVQFIPGRQQYTFALPPSAGRGVYHVVISNKRWTTTRRFLIL